MKNGMSAGTLGLLTVCGWAVMGIAGCGTRTGGEGGTAMNVPAGLMSDREFEIAAASLRPIDQRMEIEYHNLANVNTPGFRATRYFKPPAHTTSESQSATVLDMSIGTPVRTAAPLDCMIDGAGFFRVGMPGANGYLYTRDGRFTTNAAGELTPLDVGRRLEPMVTVPRDITQITIDRDGQVLITRPGSADPEIIGVIELYRFASPERLARMGETYFVETPESGPPIPTRSGIDGVGFIISGVYECSNVDPRTVQINILRLQRERQIWEHVTSGVAGGARAFPATRSSVAAASAD